MYILDFIYELIYGRTCLNKSLDKGIKFIQHHHFYKDMKWRHLFYLKYLIGLDYSIR